MSNVLFTALLLTFIFNEVELNKFIMLVLEGHFF